MRRLRRTDGQAAVEFALTLPIAVVAVLAIAQVAVAMRNELAVELAAREGARAAAVSADPARAAEVAATRSVTLPITVSTASGRRHVSVTVTHVDSTDIALIGALLGDVRHEATVTMAIEPP